MKTFPAIRIEGGLFSPELPEKLLAGELYGQSPQDFGVRTNQQLLEEIAYAFNDARNLWTMFQRRLAKLSKTDTATTLTRDAFVIPLLRLLNFEPRYNRKAYEVDGQKFPISHRDGDANYAPPIHIEGIRIDLDRRSQHRPTPFAPHSLLQEYLNRTEALWGIVTNGKTIRLLRDTTFIRRQCYVEFDVEAILTQRLFNDFIILYRLLHRSRFPEDGTPPERCLLEQYYQHSREQGGRIREHLRENVEQCIYHLANGLLKHPQNERLRQRLRLALQEQHAAPSAAASTTATPAAHSDLPPLSPQEFYHQLLRLVYRFLFLLVAEARNLLSSNPTYSKSYSISRFIPMVYQRRAYTDHVDLWLSLRILWHLLRTDTPQLGNQPLAALLDLPVLNGELFEPLDLENELITNAHFLDAFSHLVLYVDKESKATLRVNYSALDVEELGSVYESLLDLQPVVSEAAHQMNFSFAAGTERKSTGSYYTPHELVSELLHTTLEPVVTERLQRASTQEEKINALLSLRICDPACGSGHFLLAAARFLGKELAKIQTGNQEPPPMAVREATRTIIAHCIYGVDKNPLAVELCKVALWIEAHTPGKPLTFLDHRIKCGDSLIGVFSLDVLYNGIPDEAFTPTTGDDRKYAARVKKRNKQERAGQYSFPFPHQLEEEIHKLGTLSRQLEAIADNSPINIRQKQQQYQDLRAAAQRYRTACNLWTAAFFQPLTPHSPLPRPITTEILWQYLETGSLHPQIAAFAEAKAREIRFFHWMLEFPEVFEKGGFDVVLGNPPWEMVQLEEKEFFATRDARIAKAPNAAVRKKRIKELRQKNPKLWDAYQNALHIAESTSRFLRRSGQYPFTTKGRINTYSVFAERIRALLCPTGRAGIITPTGIATDATNQHFFADLVNTTQLAAFFDFENREKLFPTVDSRMKFSLLTLSGAEVATAKPRFAFFLTRVEQLRDPRRVFSLTAEDIARINPNTRTLPVFRTRQDAELTKAIYARVPVLSNEQTGENPWGITLKQGLFNMSNDSHLFRTSEQLERHRYQRIGNRYCKGNRVYLPLYEAKMIWHYDHRFGTYEGVTSRSSTHLPKPKAEQHADPAFLVQPWYWVPAKEVERRLNAWQRQWLIGFRDVTNATNERTAIFSLLPRTGVGNKAPLIFSKTQSAAFAALQLANFSALVFDFTARQKAGGTSLNFFIVRQFPILPPSAYNFEDVLFILPRVLELTYTAWDIKPFADDVWRDAAEKLRSAIRDQWEANAAATGGGHSWELPEWITAYPEIETDPARGIPLPPFKWEEERRARLRAELDAYYARLYGLTRKQLRYILDPADLTPKELEDILDPWEEIRDPLDPAGYAERQEKSDFPGETFRVLKEKEQRQYGEYRTRRLILEAYAQLESATVGTTQPKQ